MVRPAWFAVFSGLVALGALWSCAPAGGSAAQTGNVFRYPLPELTKLDPAMVQDGDTIDVIQQVFEGLTQWGEDNKVHPNLASSWDISKDGMTYTFHIRKGIKFSNGRELTAQDFKYSIERAADPAFNSPTVDTYLYAISGLEDRRHGKASDVKGIQVVDPYTLKIQIDKPRPYFLGTLTYPVSWVVCKEALDNGKEITDVKQMIGTGPYIATSYQQDQLISLKANKGYHEGAPKIDGIDRPIVKDALTRLNKFKNGDLDLTRIERQDIPALKNDPKFGPMIHYYDRPAVYYLGLNVGTYAPFKILAVRQAIAMAVNKDRIVQQTLGGSEPAANAILPPSVLGHRDNAAVIPYNPEKAKQLLAQAGFPGGKGLPPLVLTHRDGQPDVSLVAEAVVTDLRTNLGIDCKTQKLSWTTYLDEHNRKQLDFFHMRWSADYLDPQNFLSTLLATYGEENRQNYSNPAYDKLCLQADTSMNEPERLKLYAQAEDMVLQDAVFIPIYFERDAELVSPRVHGLRESVFGHLPHTTVSLQ